VYVRARAKLSPSYCSRESLIASISRPESTVSKLFEPRGFFGSLGKEERSNSVGGSAGVDVDFAKQLRAFSARIEENRKMLAVNCTSANEAIRDIRWVASGSRCTKTHAACG